MTPAEQTAQADAALRRTFDEFSKVVGRAESAPALPAIVCLLRAALGMARFCLALLREAGRPDPIDERPRILQPV